MSQSSDTRPADFDVYWEETLKELSRFPPAPEVEPVPLRDTDFATLYGVRITSSGPYRLFGYLSIPRGRGPFPAIYYPPRYASTHEPIPQGTANAIRGQFVVFSLAGRGQRNSDRPFAAMFPGLLTEGIDDPKRYVFRGIVADACRGVEYLLSRPEVDTSRVMARGNDMALMAAALRPGLTHVECTPALFFATADLAPRTQAYPLEEVNDYLRLPPDRKDAVRRTLSYFDLRWFAPRVKATTLIMAGPPGSLLSAETLKPLAQSLGGKVEVHESQQSSYRDGLFVEEWTAKQLGLKEAIVPEHWR